MLNLYYVYGFIWWLLNLNCVFFIKIQINLEVYMIKIIYLVMGSEFLWKIYSSLYNYICNSYKFG